MDDLIVLECKKCGANLPNTLKCEYCGSQHVRFSDKNHPELLVARRNPHPSGGAFTTMEDVRYTFGSSSQFSGVPTTTGTYGRLDYLDEIVKEARWRSLLSS